VTATETAHARWMSLADYRDGGYKAGRSALVRTLWYFVSLAASNRAGFLFIESNAGCCVCLALPSPGRRHQPHVRIKYPGTCRSGSLLDRRRGLDRQPGQRASGQRRVPVAGSVFVHGKPRPSERDVSISSSSRSSLKPRPGWRRGRSFCRE